jgi:hypothetical protein
MNTLPVDKSTMPFRVYLKRRLNESSPAGDVARDIFSDPPVVSVLEKTSSLSAIEDAIESSVLFRPCDAFCDALTEAWTDWYRSTHSRGSAGDVYFIFSPDHAATRGGEYPGFVKIGWSKNVDTRLKSLQTSSPLPLTLLGKLAASRRLEKELHLRFEPYRASGEWFRLGYRIEMFLRAAIDEQSEDEDITDIIWRHVLTPIRQSLLEPIKP